MSKIYCVANRQLQLYSILGTTGAPFLHCRGISLSNFQFNASTAAAAQTEDVRDLKEELSKSGYVKGWILLDNFSKLTANGRKLKPLESVQLLKNSGKLLADTKESERLLIADKVFKATENPNAGVYSALIKSYLENNKQFDPKEMQQELERQGFMKDRVLLERLIASHCEQGQLAKAHELFRQAHDQKIKLLSGVYGHVAYGRCLNGESAQAEATLDFMEKSKLKITREVIGRMAQGLCAPKDSDKLLQLLKRAQDKYKLQLNHRQLVEVALALKKHNNTQLLPQVLSLAVKPTLYRDKNYMLQHLHCHHEFSDLLSEFLVDYKLINYNMLAIVIDILFPIEKQWHDDAEVSAKLEQFFDATTSKKQFGDVLHVLIKNRLKDMQVIESALKASKKHNILIEPECLWLVFDGMNSEEQVKEFTEFLRREEIAYDIEKFPKGYALKKSLGFHEPALASLLPLFNAKFEDPIEAFEKFALFLLKKYFMSKSIDEMCQAIITCGPKDDATLSKSIVHALCGLLNSLSYVGKVDSNFKPLVIKLRQNGLKLDSKSQDLVWSLLEPKHHALGFLFTMSFDQLKEWKFKSTQYNFADVSSYSALQLADMNLILKLAGNRKYSRKSLDWRQNFYIPNVVNSAVKLQLPAKEACQVFDCFRAEQLHPGTLDQMLKCYIEIGDVEAIADLHSRHKTSDYENNYYIATLPPQYLTSNLREAMQSHLQHLHGEKLATWIFYFSYLFNDMPDQAGSLISEELEWPDSLTLHRLLLKPSTLDKLLHLIDTISDQCKDLKGFSSLPFYTSPLYTLLEQKRFEDLSLLIEQMYKRGLELAPNLRIQVLNEFKIHGVPRPDVLEPREPIEHFIELIGSGDFDAELEAIKNLETDTIPSPVVSNHLKNLTSEQYHQSRGVLSKFHPNLALFLSPEIGDKHLQVLLQAGRFGEAIQLLGTNPENPKQKISLDNFRKQMGMIRKAALSGYEELMSETGSLQQVKHSDYRIVHKASIEFVRLAMPNWSCKKSHNFDRFSENHELARIMRAEGRSDVIDRRYEEVWLNFKADGTTNSFNNFTAALIAEGLAIDTVAKNLELFERSENDHSIFTSIFVKAIDNCNNLESLLGAMTLFERFGFRRASNCAAILQKLMTTGFKLLPDLDWKKKAQLHDALNSDFVRQIPSFLLPPHVRYHWSLLMHALVFDAPMKVDSTIYENFTELKSSHENAADKDDQTLLNLLEL